MSLVARCATVTQVMSTLAELAKSQIGRSNSMKYVVAEDGIHSQMFHCSAQLLQNLDIEHPVYNVINSIVQSHHATHGHCCKTLLVMAGLWFQEMEQLIEHGLSIGEVSQAFESGLEASVGHLLQSSAVRYLDRDLNETSVEDMSFDCPMSFKDICEDAPCCPENKVLSFPPVSFGCLENSGSHVVNKQPLEEDEDIGWFFEEETKNPCLLVNTDLALTFSMEHTNSSFVSNCTDVPSQELKQSHDSQYLTENLNSTRLFCSDKDDTTLVPSLKIEDEFEDCFTDAVSSITLSETRLDTSNSHPVSDIYPSKGISNQNSKNFDLFQDKVGSNSKLAEEFSMLPGRCLNATNISLCNTDCCRRKEDKTEDSDCENATMFQMRKDETKYFASENAAEFSMRHSDLVERYVSTDSNTVASRKVSQSCSKCVLANGKLSCHCVNDTCSIVAPDCLNSAQEITSKTPNSSILNEAAAADRQQVLSSTFNISNKYSRHSLLISSDEDSEQYETAHSRQHFADNLQHQVAVGQKTRGLHVNSASVGPPKAFDCNAQIAADAAKCRSDSLGLLNSIGTKSFEKRFDCDCLENSETCKNAKDGLISMSRLICSSDAKESNKLETCNLHGLAIGRSCFEHETGFHDVFQDEKETVFCQDKARETSFDQRLTALGMKLSHGADDMMNLVIRMAYQQLKDDSSARMELDLIHTCCLDGFAEDKTCIVEGLLIPVGLDQIPLIAGERDARKTKRALLINGDLMPSFCHQGYRKVTKVTNICKALSKLEDKSEIWLNQVMKVIEQLDVGVLFMKGKVDENLLYSCLHRKVVVVEGMSYRALSALSLCTDAPLNMYISDCTECSVAKGIELQLWTTEWVKKRESVKHLTYITVKVHLSPLPVQTAVICHPVASVTHVRAEQLLHCAHRLCNTLSSRKVLVGGGTTEAVCARFLQQSADNLEKFGSNEGGLITAAVYRAIASGFLRFADIVWSNTDTARLNQDLAETIYDGCESKLETWRTALFLVTLLLRCDMEIAAKTARPSEDLVIGYL